ncbi:MAG TPA: class I SAM-dependent methyltransferase [Micromonosporaceae bacterium]|nr:class I SAM-dependent methyltransferase [Micromonosporaceae bacterium]
MSEVEGDTGLQSDVLEDLEDARNYRRWLVDLALPYLGDDPLEVGSGLGNYAAEWARAGVPRLTASEADPGRLAGLRERFAGDPVVRVRELAVPIEETAEHSAVVAYNVLEHIPDDHGALRAFAGLLRPGGAVILIVPAFPSAMSQFDLAIGHQRRYRRASLQAAVKQAGLTVEVLRHVNSVGLLGWYVMVKALKGRPKAGVPLTVYDRGVVPVLRRVEARVTPPFGQSLLVVARKT